MKKHLFTIVTLLTVGPLHAATVISDSQLGISAALPDHWIKDSGDATHILFRDTTGTCTAIIAVDRYDFGSDTVFGAPDDWTRANFIAYTFIVDADPFSAMLFYDTVSSRQDAAPWSTEAYSVFYDPQSSAADIAEYIRFTATGTCGYEIYAIGPLDDMTDHVGLYAAIVQGVTIQSAEAVIYIPASPRNKPSGGVVVRRTVRYDLLGRSVNALPLHQVSGITAGPGNRSCLFR